MSDVRYVPDINTDPAQNPSPWDTNVHNRLNGHAQAIDQMKVAVLGVQGDVKTLGGKAFAQWSLNLVLVIAIAIVAGHGCNQDKHYHNALKELQAEDGRHDRNDTQDNVEILAIEKRLGVFDKLSDTQFGINVDLQKRVMELEKWKLDSQAPFAPPPTLPKGYRLMRPEEIGPDGRPLPHTYARE